MSNYFTYLGFSLPVNGLVDREALKTAAVELEKKLRDGVFGVARNDKNVENIALYIVVINNPDMFDTRIHYRNELAYCAKSVGDKLHGTYKNLHRIYYNDHAISREEFIRQMGKLFGYSPESSNKFIADGIPYSCNCRLCGGGKGGHS